MELSKHAEEHGIKAGKVELDLSKLMQRKEKIVKQLTTGIGFLFKKNKIAHLNGTASFVDKKSIKVKSSKESTLSAKNFIIATGSSSMERPGITVDEKQIVTSTGALSLSAVPKTMLVIGAGGIGLDVGRLAAGLGMRVIGTRRTPPAVGERLPAGFSEIRTPDALMNMLPESDFIAVCCQWTPATTNLINAQTLAAMKPGGILVNVARGEIIDETALADSLDAGHLRGAALDVYTGEFAGPPPERLWNHPKILITPHTSGMTDVNRHRAIEVLCENMDRYLKGEPLINVIDWEAGY